MCSLCYLQLSWYINTSPPPRRNKLRTSFKDGRAHSLFPTKGHQAMQCLFLCLMNIAVTVQRLNEKWADVCQRQTEIYQRLHSRTILEWHPHILLEGPKHHKSECYANTAICNSSCKKDISQSSCNIHTFHLLREGQLVTKHYAITRKLPDSPFNIFSYIPEGYSNMRTKDFLP